ncbi:MAG: hypothetical protein J0I19_12280 [Alphaproteobacteria bacterium]|nr:hypothetical protein [Alphaproteobacteria bacterium]
MKNLVILLLALAVIGGAMPASAMPMPAMSAHAMTAMPGKAMQMPCDRHMPAHHAPCDRQCCSCVLGGTALLNNPLAVASAAMISLRPAWPSQSRPENLTEKPALPPPIA